MREIYARIEETLKESRQAVLATIVRQAGATPRGIGAQCLILPDGTLVETVGGGRLEAETVQAAAGVLETGRPMRLRFRLTGEDVAGTEMICGGDVEVFLEPLRGDARAAREIYRQVSGVLQGGGAGRIQRGYLGHGKGTGGDT